jgi:hypothetical protein
MTEALQKELLQALVSKIISSFNKDFQNVLKSVKYGVRLEGHPLGSLKLDIVCRNLADYRQLKRKAKALHYRVKQLAPTIKCVFIYYPNGNDTYPCLLIDTTSGSVLELGMTNQGFALIPHTEQQKKELFGGQI